MGKGKASVAVGGGDDGDVDDAMLFGVEQVLVSVAVLLVSLLLLSSRRTRAKIRLSIWERLVRRRTSGSGGHGTTTNGIHPRQSAPVNMGDSSEFEISEFVRNWAKIKSCPYRKLVLSPSCKRVRQPNETLKRGGESVKKIVQFDYVGALRIVFGQTCRFVVNLIKRALTIFGRLLRTKKNGGETQQQQKAASHKNTQKSHEDDDAMDDDSVVTLTSSTSATDDHHHHSQQLHAGGGGEAHDHESKTPQPPERQSSFSSCTSNGTRGERSMSESSYDGGVVGPDSSATPLHHHYYHYGGQQQQQVMVGHSHRHHQNQPVVVVKSRHSLHLGREKDALASYRKRSLNFVVTPKSTPQHPHRPPSSATEKHGRHKSEQLNFFDAPSSDAAMRKLSRDVLVPDSHGYILCPPSDDSTPLLVFVNSRSGLQQGHVLITQLRRLLNPIQVWDLADGGPENVLESFSALPRLRILVCGGDGTVSWIMSAVEKMDSSATKRRPPIAILPLGTGNDLARVHGWGGGYNNESLILILHRISEAFVSVLDQWELSTEIKGKKKRKIKSKGKTSKKTKTFTNYFGVGVDAHAALQVHMLRERKPTLFFSRAFNKAWYLFAGAEDVFEASCAGLPEQMTLVADGVEVPLPPGTQGVIFLNIDSYSGGVPFWSNGHKPRTLDRSSSVDDFLVGVNSPSFRRRAKFRQSVDKVDSTDYSYDAEFNNIMTEEEKRAKVTACDLPSSCQDGLLDVVSVRGSFHLGQIRVGLSSALRICQCSEAKITLKKTVSVQVDGEPWRQRPATLAVRAKKDPVNMLHRASDDGGGMEAEMSKLFDWAEERGVIDSNAHAILMREFSRRIEKKTRHRVRS